MLKIKQEDLEATAFLEHVQERTDEHIVALCKQLISHESIAKNVDHVDVLLTAMSTVMAMLGKSMELADRPEMDDMIVDFTMKAIEASYPLNISMVSSDDPNADAQKVAEIIEGMKATSTGVKH
jgi:hypothetical protein